MSILRLTLTAKARPSLRIWPMCCRGSVKKNAIHRVTFNEITPKAVKAAFAEARDVDQHLVDAQQTRRVLDRIVGYQISPLLWDKVRRGLSAGRVQTVALRLIVEREREIKAFNPVEYWTIDANLHPAPKGQEFTARFIGVDGERARVETVDAPSLPDQKLTDETVAQLNKAAWSVRNVERKERKRNPAAPFTTSKLQQDASRQLGFNVKRTMGVAQRLYEGVEIGSEGAVGLITYMRTDSTRVSPDAIAAVRDWIKQKLGDAYLPASPNAFKSKKDAQDAHEAIRPANPELHPGRDPPLSLRRTVQALQTHLAALRCFADDACGLRPDHRRHRRQGRPELRFPRYRLGAEIRRLSQGLRGGEGKEGRRRRVALEQASGAE